MAADQLENADRLTEIHTRTTIESIRSLAGRRELEPQGKCHFCAEVFEEGDPRLFCDGDCATDHERLKKQHQGRA